MDRPQHMRLPKAATLRGKALRWLAGFLALMAMLTVLSRVADELTIPQVTMGQPRARTIDMKITGYGRVEEVSARAVTAYAGLTVSGVAVKDGSYVEQGAPLFTLDEADVETKLEAARKELEQLDMDIRDMEGRDALNQKDKATAVSRAGQDYEAAKKAADKEVARAAKALEDAQRALDSYLPPVAADTAALELELREAEGAELRAREALDALEAELKLAIENARAESDDPDAAETEVRGEYQSGLDTAGQALGDAEAARLRAEEKLAEANQQGSLPDQTASLKQSVELARENYERALDSRDSSLRQASRALEDAQRPSAPDSSGEKLKMRRDEQAAEVERLDGILSSGCTVRAPESGTVTGVYVFAGSPTPSGAALLMAGDSGSALFTAQVGDYWEKYISPGDPVILKPSGDKDEITGLQVESAAHSGIEGLLDVTVRLPEGTLPVGASAELTCIRRSEEYPSCVPLTALHSENDKFYLLVPETTQTILGPQTIARRLEVEVIEKNDTYAALDGVFGHNQRFLLYSSKPVNPGDRIRQVIS